MISAIVNTIAVIIGGSIGLLLKSGIPKRFSALLIQGIGLCTVYIGISGALKGENHLILILSVVIGILIGEGLDLNDKLNRFANMLERKVSKNSARGSVSQGFITASLIFCVGSMAIVGSMQSGLTGNHEMIYAKSMLDFITAMIYASSLGIGVVFSAAFVLVFQGSIVLFAQQLAPLLTEHVVNEMICAGSIVIIALGLNMVLDTKIKVINILPATFIPIIICQFL